MLLALDYALQTKGDLSIETYQTIHKKVLDNFRQGKGPRSNTQSYMDRFKSIDFLGILEILKSFKGRVYLSQYKNIGAIMIAPDVFLTYLDPPSLEEVRNFIGAYNKAIKAAKTDIEKIQAIIQIATDLVRYHYYEDGNGRTMLIILQRELTKHGFSPVILEDPNQFDGLSQRALYDKIIEGMENFKYVVEKGNYPGADSSLTTDKILERHP